jgi:hypothetical protein
LVIIFHYRWTNVEARYEEIRNALMDSEDGNATAARHYLQLFTRTNVKPDTPTTEIERSIRRHFSQFHGLEQYIVPTALCALLSAGALYFIWGWVAGSVMGKFQSDTFGVTVSKELAFALIGAYIFSLYEIVQRRRTGDLTPDELYDVALRYVVALPIGHIGTLLSVDSFDAGLAFAVSAVPLRDVKRIIRKRAFERMKMEDATKESTRAGYLRDVVDGLGSETLARLEELQIVTFTDLAYADPIRIMVKTGYPLRYIIQWMDHATFAIYAFDSKRKLGENAVVCSLDAKEFYRAHYQNARRIDTCPAITSLSTKTGLDPAILGEILMRVSIDPQVLFLETMWYTGYIEKQPELPACPFHGADSVAARANA